MNNNKNKKKGKRKLTKRCGYISVFNEFTLKVTSVLDEKETSRVMKVTIVY